MRDDEIRALLDKYDLPNDAVWKVQGGRAHAIYHWAVEIMAAKSGIEWNIPTVLRADKDGCAILVIGALDGRMEWSIGEAQIGLNYQVSGKQPGYPFAMAEKRGKDRVIIKLLQLDGLLSDVEADDLMPPQKARKAPPAAEQGSAGMETPADTNGRSEAVSEAPSKREPDEDMADRINAVKMEITACLTSDAVAAIMKRDDVAKILATQPAAAVKDLRDFAKAEYNEWRKVEATNRGEQ